VAGDGSNPLYVSTSLRRGIVKHVLVDVDEHRNGGLPHLVREATGKDRGTKRDEGVGSSRLEKLEGFFEGELGSR
jgi:hypothetical protein